MNEPLKYAALGAVLSACAGPAASGQSAPGDPGDLARLYAYEIPNEQIADMRQETPERAWIEVSGTGSVEVPPDRARISFAMETRATAASDASGQNADAMDAVLTALRGGNFDGLTLETSGYALQPEYATSNDQRTREIIAYTAMNVVHATVADVEAVGRVVDTAIGAGANRVAGISFFASDTDAAREEALALAVRTARSEAEVIAESLGYRLGPPLEIHGGAQRPTPRPFQGEMMAASRARDTPIEAGEQTVTANVTVRFALGPELGG